MIKSVFVSPDNMATFICPKCGKGKLVDVSRYMHKKPPIKIKFRINCNCGYQTDERENVREGEKKKSDIVILERREYYRKAVKLPGQVIYGQLQKAEIMVLDLSVTGLRFYSDIIDSLRVDDPITVEFTLPDKKKTLIKKKCIVRKIDFYVGVQFVKVSDNNPYDVAILSYLIK